MNTSRVSPVEAPPTGKPLSRGLTHTILTREAAEVTLSTILPSRKTSRVLVIFIRHFLCGNCQQYLLTLKQQIPLASLPADLSIVVVGCGAASLIPSYNEIVQCPYEIFTDPTNSLYQTLGMHRSWSLGSRNPEYIQRSLIIAAMKSVVQGIKRVGSGDVFSAGDMAVNGGEFLFVKDEAAPEGWKVEWCHRMKNTRDHTEVDVLKRVLGLDAKVPAPAPSEEKEKEATDQDTVVQPLTRRATTSKMQRAMNRRSQSWVQNLTRNHTMRSGPGSDQRPKGSRFHSHSASVTIVSAS